ncbi:MAG: hypothetical protein KDH96_01915 [Candidatus Riesia sp.]|nr:hypothetical protein [Candidatus Riesia sp.]
MILPSEKVKNLEIDGEPSVQVGSWIPEKVSISHHKWGCEKVYLMHLGIYGKGSEYASVHAKYLDVVDSVNAPTDNNDAIVYDNEVPFYLRVLGNPGRKTVNGIMVLIEGAPYVGRYDVSPSIIGEALLNGSSKDGILSGEFVWANMEGRYTPVRLGSTMERVLRASTTERNLPALIPEPGVIYSGSYAISTAYLGRYWSVRRDTKGCYKYGKHHIWVNVGTRCEGESYDLTTYSIVKTLGTRRMKKKKGTIDITMEAYNKAVDKDPHLSSVSMKIKYKLFGPANKKATMTPQEKEAIKNLTGRKVV